MPTILHVARVLAVALLLVLSACEDSAQPAPPTTSRSTSGESTGPGTSEPGTPSSPGEGFDPNAVTVRLRPVAEGLTQPLFVIGSGDGSGRLYVVEQGGLIKVVEPDGAVRPDPYLDLSEEVTNGFEQGLLGLAFHPDFPEDPRVFVDYTDRNGDTVVTSFEGDADSADISSREDLLHIDQPFSNHNGGMVGFGPDGFLYIGMGDGGGGGDPEGNGQRTDTLLAKILRIDVDGGDPYAIPPGNPFADGSQGRPEAWAIGLRNPWRFAFDPPTGALFIADVGQGDREEVDAIPFGDAGSGSNLGWNVMEGSECYGGGDCDRNGLVLPVAEYSHDEGCSVTGGPVYRGSAFPDLVGGYLYADYCSGRMWVLDAEAAAAGEPVEPVWVLDTGFLVSSFGVDDAGEVYVTDHGGGRVLQVVTVEPD
jgi:glucose/arabinose dehydrogenase